jgi:hypothetical protein
MELQSLQTVASDADVSPSEWQLLADPARLQEKLHKFAATERAVPPVFEAGELKLLDNRDTEEHLKHLTLQVFGCRIAQSAALANGVRRLHLEAYRSTHIEAYKDFRALFALPCTTRR